MDPSFPSIQLGPPRTSSRRRRPPLQLHQQSQIPMFNEPQSQSQSQSQSLSSERPAVDPDILGIPQGWEDDPGIIMPGAEEISETSPEPRSVPLRQRIKRSFAKDRSKSKTRENVEKRSNPTSSIPSLPRSTFELHRPHLHSPDLASPFQTPSIRSTPSQENRELDLKYPSLSRTFKLPVEDALPFSTSRLYSAWDLAEKTKDEAGWVISTRGKKTWRCLETSYTPGWEPIVLEAEARLHETMYDLFQTHTQVKSQPRTVLDLGTGLGLWPISQAQVWKKSNFVGFDVVPVHPNLASLAQLERHLNQDSNFWADLHSRIVWQQGDFLKSLPFDTGSFDMVHIRFIGLGVPEPQWLELLEESVRVLNRGGNLEIVEMGHISASDIQNRFISFLETSSIAPLPSHPINFALPMITSLVPSTIRPIHDGFTKHPVLCDYNSTVAHSSMEYKSTPRTIPGVDRVQFELSHVGSDFEIDYDVQPAPVPVTTWVVTKK